MDSSLDLDQSTIQEIHINSLKMSIGLKQSQHDFSKLKGKPKDRKDLEVLEGTDHRNLGVQACGASVDRYPKAEASGEEEPCEGIDHQAEANDHQEYQQG